MYAQNVYEYREGRVYLISDGHDTGQVYSEDSTVGLEGITPSGEDVLFRTADPLVAQDTDTQVDIYDGRVDGGFPVPVPSGLCGEGACREAPGAPPSLPVLRWQRIDRRRQQPGCARRFDARREAHPQAPDACAKADQSTEGV